MYLDIPSENIKIIFQLLYVYIFQRNGNNTDKSSLRKNNEKEINLELRYLLSFIQEHVINCFHSQRLCEAVRKRNYTRIVLIIQEMYNKLCEYRY